jgi:peptidoglycan/LPS O-acetylase OafA/YrhL
VPAPSFPKVPALYPLTTFRFFAAAAIVIFHTVAKQQSYLGSGVSFFYVLSGFILVHVHPVIPLSMATLRFWIARLARIWPLHFATFLFIFLVPWGVPIQRHFWTAAFLNIGLLQSWIPISRIDLAFNGVSWSLSVELFFYLLFPFLLPLVTRSPGKMLLLACLFRLLLSLGGVLIGLPDGAHEHEPSYAAFICFNPAVHLYKFVCGMALAMWWIRHRERFAPSTRHETLSVAATAILLPSCFFLLRAIDARNSYLVLDQITDIISTVLFGVMIFVFAYQRGAISKLLSHPSLVYLGEISFGIYMLHGITLDLMARGFGLRIDSWFFPLCVAAIIGVSATTYHWIEKPSRLAITRAGARLLGKGPEIDHPVPIELVSSDRR